MCLSLKVVVPLCWAKTQPIPYSEPLYYTWESYFLIHHNRYTLWFSSIIPSPIATKLPRLLRHNWYTFDISSLLIFRFITFFFFYHRHTVASSLHRTITSAQARHHTVTSPLLKLTVMTSPHVCYSSPSPHPCYSLPSFQLMERRKIHDAIEEEEEQEEREGIKRWERMPKKKIRT